MNESELKQRTKQFALRVTKLVRVLPESVEGRAIGSQLMRCGTSVGANYRAAAEPVPKRSSSRSWELSKRKRMKVLSGWNLSLKAG